MENLKNFKKGQTSAYRFLVLFDDLELDADLCVSFVIHCMVLIQVSEKRNMK